MRKFVALASVIPLLLVAGCTSPQPETTLEEPNSLEIVASDPFSDDEYSLRVIVAVTNTSQDPVSVTCIVKSFDANNKEVTAPFEVTTDSSLSQNEHDLLVADIPVSKGNASDAIESEANCTSTQAPAETWPLVVSEVSDCSFFDDETKRSYWYACFKVAELEPFTKVDCKILALSKSGNLILVQRFKGNVLNDRSVTPSDMQSDDSVMPTARKDFVDAISSFEIKCRISA